MHTVHIIEDNHGLRQSLCMFLSGEGWQAIPYATASSFLLSPSRDGQDCVLADLHLPGLTAFELLAELKERRLTLPVIVMTADTNMMNGVKAIALGAADFIVKPFAAKTLRDTVRDALVGCYLEDKLKARVQSARDSMASLKPRQRDVLARLIKGLPSTAIASELGLSAETVVADRTLLMARMSANSLPRLIRNAVLADPNIAG